MAMFQVVSQIQTPGVSFPGLMYQSRDLEPVGHTEIEMGRVSGRGTGTEKAECTAACDAGLEGVYRQEELWAWAEAVHPWNVLARPWVLHLLPSAKPLCQVRRQTHMLRFIKKEEPRVCFIEPGTRWDGDSISSQDDL